MLRLALLALTLSLAACSQPLLYTGNINMESHTARPVSANLAIIDDRRDPAELTYDAVGDYRYRMGYDTLNPRATELLKRELEARLGGNTRVIVTVESLVVTRDAEYSNDLDAKPVNDRVGEPLIGDGPAPESDFVTVKFVGDINGDAQDLLITVPYTDGATVSWNTSIGLKRAIQSGFETLAVELLKAPSAGLYQSGSTVQN